MITITVEQALGIILTVLRDALTLRSRFQKQDYKNIKCEAKNRVRWINLNFELTLTLILSINLFFGVQILRAMWHVLMLIFVFVVLVGIQIIVKIRSQITPQHHQPAKRTQSMIRVLWVILVIL